MVKNPPVNAGDTIIIIIIIIIINSCAGQVEDVQTDVSAHF